MAKAIDAVIKFFTETDWRQVGIDVVVGIANGIRAGVAWAVSAIKAVANSVWDAITGFFSAKSYSRLMAGLGDDLMQGLAVGIEQNAGVPASAAASAGQHVYSSLTQSTMILGGVNLPSVSDKSSFLEEISELTV